MSSERLRARIPEAEPVGRARWPGMRLAFNKVGVDGSGKANLVEDAAAIAWGVMFAIPFEAWPTLDGYEPGYVRSTCTLVADDDQPTPAEVYLATGPFLETAPHGWYRDHLLTGAIEHALPADVIQRIKAL
jgi:hypothetical protein